MSKEEEELQFSDFTFEDLDVLMVCLGDVYKQQYLYAVLGAKIMNMQKPKIPKHNKNKVAKDAMIFINSFDENEYKKNILKTLA